MHYKTADSTAKSSTDYKSTEDNLTFAVGETSKSILIPIVDDKLVESSEFFRVVLSSPKNALLASGGSSAKVTITDDDTKTTVSKINTVNGTKGNDALTGTTGDDLIIGKAGKDYLEGDTGNDIFAFSMGDSGVGKAARDVIADFEIGDKIDLSGFGKNTLSFIGSNAFTASNQVRFSVENSQTIVAINLDDNFKTSESEIQLTGSVSLTAQNFVL